MQFADKANQFAAQRNAGTAARVHGRVLGGCKGGLQRRQQGLNIPFYLEEISALLLAAPLQHVPRATHHARHAHRLVKTFNRGVGVLDGSIAQEHAAQLEDANTLGLAVQVEL